MTTLTTINGSDNVSASRTVINSNFSALNTGKKEDSMSTNKLLGRGTAGTGVIEEITLGTGLSLTGTTLNATASGSGDMVLASSQTNSGLKTFLDGTFGLRNVANTFTGLFTNAITAARTWTLPDVSGTIALLSNKLSSFASTTSSELAGVISDETGSGPLVFATSPTLTTPNLGTPASGNLSNCTADGTDQVGFKNIPINSQSAAYTLVLADAGKTIFHPSADTTARTWTIPANSSVAFPIGTTIVFDNDIGAGVITISITTDTLVLVGSVGSTGSRTLASGGRAVATKVSSTRWRIDGNLLT